MYRAPDNMGRRKNAFFIAVSVTLSTLIALLLGEIGLRLISRTPDYDDTWTSPLTLGRGGFLKPKFDGLVSDGLGGLVRWHNNSDGFRNDHEFGPFPPPSTLRIISMGDSFTSGYRVAQEETFSFLLEKWITGKGTPSEVIVSCIEDPFTGLSWLRRFGAGFHPDVVLLGLTLGNDIAEAYVCLNQSPSGFWHGLETDMAPDRCFSRSASWSENLKAKLAEWDFYSLRLVRVFGQVIHPIENESPQAIVSSYRAQCPGRLRLFDYHNGLCMYIRDPPEEINEAYRRLFRILLDCKTFTEKNNIGLVLMIFPQRFQIQSQDWDKTVQVYGLNPEAFDLYAPNRRISGFCREQSIPLIDPTERMRNEWHRQRRTMYLPLGDMHWNSYGHRIFFESARDQLLQILSMVPKRKGEITDFQ